MEIIMKINMNGIKPVQQLFNLATATTLLTALTRTASAIVRPGGGDASPGEIAAITQQFINENPDMAAGAKAYTLQHPELIRTEGSGAVVDNVLLASTPHVSVPAVVVHNPTYTEQAINAFHQVAGCLADHKLATLAGLAFTLYAYNKLKNQPKL
jgi:hypothetical protein